jgi:hypothetical protein
VVLNGLRGLEERAAARELAETASLQLLRGTTTPEIDDVFEDAESDMDETEAVRTPARAPADISAELRAAEERSALLRLGLARHPVVRRGRRTSSRGGCHVPGHVGVVSGNPVQCSRDFAGDRATAACRA